MYLNSLRKLLLMSLRFQVGKPGSSKSLALRLINANLRGVDSSDAFYRQLPTVSVLLSDVSQRA
jgi:hypothetical protein